MLLLAWLLFIAWIVLMFAIVASHGFAGPAFWGIQAALFLGVLVWGMYFARQRRRENLPHGYSAAELVLLCLFAILMVGGMGTCAGLQGYSSNQISRWHRTKIDMHNIANAWENYAQKQNQFNAAGAVVITVDNQPRTFRYTFGSDVLEPALVPTYLNRLPRTDGWGHDWQFGTDEPFPRGSGGPAQIYMIRSAGSNGTFDPIVPGPVKYYDCDIVYSNGAFVSW